MRTSSVSNSFAPATRTRSCAVPVDQVVHSSTPISSGPVVLTSPDGSTSPNTVRVPAVGRIDGSGSTS